MFSSKAKNSAIAVCCLLSLGMCTVGIPLASAEESAHSLSVDTRAVAPDDAHFVELVSSVGTHFYTNDEGALSIDLSDADLVGSYGFSASEVTRLHDAVLGVDVARSEEEVQQTIHSMQEDRVSVQGSAVCFSHDDLITGVGTAIATAAAVSPEALLAAFEAVQTALGGPVGATLGAILAIMAVPSMYEIAGVIIDAVASGNGVKIGVRLHYPPVYAEYC